MSKLTSSNIMQMILKLGRKFVKGELEIPRYGNLISDQLLLATKDGNLIWLARYQTEDDLFKYVSLTADVVSEAPWHVADLTNTIQETGKYGDFEVLEIHNLLR